MLFINTAIRMGMLGAMAAVSVPAWAADKLDRTVLPIHEPEYPPVTELDVRKATHPPRFQVKAPEDAPNVLIVLIDDMGFRQSIVLGGPIPMRTADRLAKGSPV
jgi:hypothetical protein